MGWVVGCKILTWGERSALGTYTWDMALNGLYSHKMASTAQGNLKGEKRQAWALGPDDGIGRSKGQRPLSGAAVEKVVPQKTGGGRGGEAGAGPWEGAGARWRLKC